MPTFLDFNNTKVFRDFLISKTLNRPNGPQTFTDTNYTVQNLSNFPNIDPGDVKTNWETYWNSSWVNNLYTQPNSVIEEYIETSLPLLVWINNGSVIQGYTDSFTPITTNLVSIMSGQNFDNDSRLMKFATNNIRTNRQGPVFARIEQNLRASTIGRVRIIDALSGNLSTAINIVTGREPLIEKNYKITTASTLLGKGVDFLQTVAGVEFPFSEIPGDYLSNPRRPVTNRPEPNTATGALLQDVSGTLGNFIGIQRRPKLTRKPSDLFIEYMGQGQRQILFDQLSYSKYAPNYTTSARSQQSSRLFNFTSNIGGGVNRLLGLEAPNSTAYIGDDRSEDVRYTMSDFNDNMVKSSYYLSVLFDPVQASLFERQKNISEGGPISTKLTWISKNSQNKIGLHNQEFNSVESDSFNTSLSTKYGFREDSILNKTQELLDSMPKDGLSSRTHVGNVIDQTSRIFKEGESMLSRGSAVKYVDKYNQETGAEFCRVWTKDRSYMNYSDTMRRTSNLRKFDDSVLGGESRPWNINIGPMSSGKYDNTGENSFGSKNSTNILKGPDPSTGYGGDGFYAKKYMFSIENLAWRTSNTPGFTYNDLPFCERGSNGGRIMWFPPYDLKISEQNQARWQDNTFLGRPEPIYTYQDTSRSGQLSFKVIVDHPSILNLLVREYFKGMSDEESENYINAFFSGCEELDFYGLVRRFAQLDSNDIRLVQSFLNKGIEPELIQQYKLTTEFPITEDPSTNDISTETITETVKVNLKYENDKPDSKSQRIVTSQNYSNLYNSYKNEKQNYINKLESSIITLTGLTQSDPQVIKEKEFLFGSNFNITQTDIDKIKNDMSESFDRADSDFNTYVDKVNQLIKNLQDKKVQEVRIKISSSASSVSSEDYNEKLSMRRSHSVIQDLFDRLSQNGIPPLIKWPLEFKLLNKNNGENDKEIIQKGEKINITKEYNFKDFGFDYDGKIIIESYNYGEFFTGAENNPEQNCIGKDFTRVPDLKQYSPIAFYCRQTSFEMNYNVSSEKVATTTTTPTPITVLEPNGKIPVSEPVRRPAIDPLKRVIAKTLSECLYFKKLEENDPIVFKSLKDKLKYFHPAFHSMTPEGLNSRLTFLLQCIRPGDTIPIKGISDDNDIRARNTSFGPPPVCVLRIGDFYHSKVVIRDVNITYEEGGGMTWDLNPEGIGVQPMIANVTLSLNFIGGQGLSKPVERLQNALSSNFFANTEMYDERSISTNKTIGGKEVEEFSKQFLGEVLNRTYSNIPPKSEPQNIDNITDTGNMGKLEGDEINYTDLLDSIQNKSEEYIKTLEITYNELYELYGRDITTMMLSNVYRPINQYDIFTLTSPTPSKTIELHGTYGLLGEFSKYKIGLKTTLLSFINNSTPNYLVNMLKFDKEIPNQSILNDTNEKILKQFFIREIIDGKIESLSENNLKNLEKIRNSLIEELDRINFVVKNGFDSKIKNSKVESSTLLGFTGGFLYDEYGICIEYVEKNQPRILTDLTTNITFLNPSIQPTDFDFMMSELLHDKIENMMSLFTDKTLYPDSITKKLRKRLEKFINKPEKKKFKLVKFKKRKTGKTFKYKINTTIEETNPNVKEEVRKIFSDNNELTDKLNLYRKK
jgi:outer membrane protein OmpA-like peptidoglycan-associated protein